VIFTSGALANTEIMILDHVALGGGSHQFKLTGLVGSVVVGDTFDVYQLTSVLQFNASNVRIYSDTPLRFHYIRFVIDNTLTFRSRGVFMVIGSAIFPSTTGSGPITINCTCETVQTGGLSVNGPVICGNPTRNAIVNINNECNNFTIAGLGASYTAFVMFYSGTFSIVGSYLYNSTVYITSNGSIESSTIEADAATLQVPAVVSRDNLKGLVTIQGGTLDLVLSVVVGNSATLEANRHGVLVLGGLASVRSPCEITGVTGHGIYVSGGQANVNTSSSANVVINNCLGSGVLVRHGGTLNVHDKNTAGLRGTGNTRYGVESTGGSVMVTFPATGTTISGTLGQFFDGTSLITWSQIIPGNWIHSSTGPINVAGYIELWRAFPPSQAFGNVTADGLRGVLTFTTTLAAGSSATATVFNIYVFSSSTVLVNLVEYTGTPFTNGLPRIWVSNVSNGQFTLVLINEHSTNALNGTIKVGFLVVGKFS
jgi:hypothetical protein